MVDIHDYDQNLENTNVLKDVYNDEDKLKLMAKGVF